MSRDPVVERLLRELWSRDADYYARARETIARERERGAGYDFLDAHLPVTGRILEVGCGEGSNLEALARPGRATYGCDLSPLAARLAAARARGLVAVAEAEHLPFAGSSFDGVVAVSVIEHLPDPEAAVAEMVRVLAPGGTLALLSPQYGGPLGASPNRSGGGAFRFLRRWLRAHRTPSGSSLGWDRVHPRVLSEGVYEGDLDAVCEPELQTLHAHLEHLGLRVIAATSGYSWSSWTEWNGTRLQRAIRVAFEALGRRGVPPYRDFGPVVAIAALKGAS